MRGRVVVVGLGPAGPELLTAATVEAIDRVGVRFVRTARHPSASAVGTATSFDEVYETEDTLEGVYATIIERLVEESLSHGEVLYAVPGSPFVAERTVGLLVADARVDVEVLPAMSFADLAWARLGVDPLAAGVRLVDGRRFAVDAAGERGPMLVAQCDSRQVLSDIKLSVEDGPDGVVVLQRLGLPDESVTTLSWDDLDRKVTPDHLTSIYLPRLAEPVGPELARFVELVRRLRQECPWDREQTHASLTRHLLEETYEVLEAIDNLVPDAAAAPDFPPEPAGPVTPGPSLGTPSPLRGAPSRGTSRGATRRSRDDQVAAAYEHLEEELGDLLFQVVFHSTLAAEAGRFTLADVARTVHDKLVGRHPHVFGDVAATSAGEVVANWERSKMAEKGRSSVMEGIPAQLPALLLAQKVARKAASVGLDLQAAATGDDVGDQLLALVLRARAEGVDAEAALRATVTGLRSRFLAMEAAATADGLELGAVDAGTLQCLWEAACR